MKKIQELNGYLEENNISRKDMILNTGKIALGVSAGAALLSGCAAKGFAAEFPYKKLDPDEVGEITYQNWYKGFCSYAVVSGIFQPLARIVGEPYKSFPLDAVKWGHGGGVGWGTMCGTLTATGIVTGFIARKEGEAIFNDVIAWYSATNLPVFKSKNAKAEIKNQNISNSPLCHVSVGKWSSKEGVDFFSAQRKERCARLSADIAMHTVKLLNERLEGKYKPSYGSQITKHKTTAQNNCKECHK